MCKPAIAVDASKVKLCGGVLTILVEEAFTDLDDSFGLIEKRGKLLLIAVQTVQIKLNHALKEWPARIARRHAADRIEDLYGIVYFKAVEAINPADGEIVHRGPVGGFIATVLARLTGMEGENTESEEEEGSHDKIIEVRCWVRSGLAL